MSKEHSEIERVIAVVKIKREICINTYKQTQH